MTGQDILRQRFKINIAAAVLKAAREEAVRILPTDADESQIATTAHSLIVFIAASEIRGALIRDNDD